MTGLQDLPNEILYQIFLSMPPPSILNIQQVCTRFRDISKPVLWRHFCQEYYKFWSPEWKIKEKLEGNVHQTDWKAVFIKRHHLDRATSSTFDSLLSQQHDRIAKVDKMLSHGYDIKDTLMRSVNADDSFGDVLARQYYGRAVVETLHRSAALDEWRNLLARDEETPLESRLYTRGNPLERALGCFDLCVRHDEHADLGAISQRLDDIADDLLNQTPEFSGMTRQSKCLEIATFLRSQNLVGLPSSDSSGATYHSLKNNFIGIALQRSDHSSLPLISVVIFCAVAVRLGIDARPCGYPFHVFAVIDMTADDEEDQAPHSSSKKPWQKMMYMDPFRSETEVNVLDLKSQLSSIGIPESEHDVHLGPTSNVEIVCRCAKNILTSLRTAMRSQMHHAEPFPISAPDARYAAMWALLILWRDDTDARDAGSRLHFMLSVAQDAELAFPFDAPLIDKHIIGQWPIPGIRREDERPVRQVRNRIDDSTPKQPVPRTGQARKSVKYKVGQCFQHRRYHYFAVITGWDVECSMGEAWIERMRVNDLSRGRYQSFYHVQVEDGSYRYVAEDNITVFKTTPSDELMALAGKYFKRWDSEAGKFVSNIRDQYPDD